MPTIQGSPPRRIQGPAAPGLRDPSEQPPLMLAQVGQVSWRTVRGPLFINGTPTERDVVQHGAGDCYFMAALAEAARVRPELIKQAIRQNADGTYTATFFDAYSPGAPLRKVEVVIDGKLPWKNDGKGLAYANRRGSNALWPELLEKAYAKWRGGYDAIGHGGGPGRALMALTGFPSTTQKTADFQNSAARVRLHQQIASTLAAGGLVTAATLKAEPAGAGIAAGHEYSVIGTRVGAQGLHWVTLRNPWGRFEPGHDGANDGVFQLPMPEFVKRFGYVEFAAPKGA